MNGLVNSVLLAAIEGHDLTADELSFFKKAPPAGIILFSRNISPDNSNLKNLINSFKSIYKDAGLRPIIAIDQEGGRVRRIKDNFPDKGPAMALEDGDFSSLALKNIYEYGQEIGAALKEYGVNVNFAPVADVLTNPENIAIGDRAFSTVTDVASKRALSFLLGMQSMGVLGCTKHFPGQGAAPEDTHLKTSIIEDSEKTIFERDIAAFSPLLEHSHMVMMSHCTYPALDDEPASLSHKIITGLLQNRLNFNGAIVSDDMMMKSIPQEDEPWCEALVKSIMAGTNLLLICRSLEKYKIAYEALNEEARNNPSFKSTLENSKSKIDSLRKLLSF